MEQKKTSSLRFMLAGLFLGVVLIVINCYWIVSSENRVVWELTDFSIFPTVLFTLFSVAGVNLLLNRFTKNSSLNQTELATVYIMISIATALAGHDIIRQLVPLIGNAFWYATPENEWEDLFFRYIPRWLTVDDKRILEGYFEGGTTFWEAKYMKAWFVPILAWSGFVIVALFVMLCINIIVRRQWIEHEKLSYPITVLPLEVISNTSSIFSNRLMWIGFGIAFGIEIMAGIHFLYPSVPYLNLKYELGRLFTEKPWNAMGWLPINIYAFAVGLGYLMPLDLSLSLWVFYLFWKLQLVFFSVVGWKTVGGYQGEQRAGAWIGIGILALWTSRKHIKRVLFGIFSKRPIEPLSKMAIAGFIIGMVIIVFFWYQAGLEYWVTLLYFGIYFVLCIAMTRMRAELGPPTHELHGIHPDRVMVMFMGSRKLGALNLTNTTLLSWLAYGYRCHPMPHQLEGFKIGSSLKISDKRLVTAMILAIVVGTITAIMAHVVIYHNYLFARWGVGEFNRLRNWIAYPTSTDVPALQQMGFGFSLAALFMILKRRFFWWPLYPVGYAVGSGWAISWMWFSILLGWLSKRVILSGGGLKAHRNAMPLFFGFILGQFLAGSLWSIIGILLTKRVYTLFP